MNVQSLDAVTILSDSVFEELFDISNEIERTRLEQSLKDRANALGVKTKFNELLRAYRKMLKQPTITASQMPENITAFDYFDDGKELYSGGWICNDNGVSTIGMFGNPIMACSHPILPVERLINAETGREKVKIAYKLLYSWKDLTVDRSMIASANKIIGLADWGIDVTSESAKFLVRYLSDLINMNRTSIDEKTSTSKLGWIGDEFIPYGMDIQFDADQQFKDIFESVTEKGNEDKWYNLVHSIRKSGRFEPMIYLAASFGSVLLKKFNALPFIVNLWGETGKGKTVALMLATSVWANPGESKYITDPSSTNVAVEFLDNVLNHLPLVIDDLSKVKDKYGDGFTDFVYLLCSGKGRSRGTKDLGLRATTTWQNIVLTNIERPLASDTMRGGAINRILDFEMDDGSIFESGNKVVNVISKNYGFAGKLFVEVIESMEQEELERIQQKYLSMIKDACKSRNVQKEEKQMIPMSILLTADEIAEEYIFKDGIRLDFDKCFDSLKNTDEVSENERAYEFILSEIAINQNKFEPDDEGNYRGEIWGCADDEFTYIVNNAFYKIVERGGFSSKAFLQWAAKKNLIVQDGNKNSKNKKVNGKQVRCIWLRMDRSEVDENGFIAIDPEQTELPFD